MKIRIKELEEQIKSERLKLRQFKQEIKRSEGLDKIIAWSLLNSIEVQFTPSGSFTPNDMDNIFYEIRFRKYDKHISLKDISLSLLIKLAIDRKERIFAQLSMIDIIE